jgi:hypothetical protein
MRQDDREASESSGLNELVELRLSELLSRIGKASPDDLEAELKALGSLLDTYKHSDELLEKLLEQEITEDAGQELIDEIRAGRLSLSQGLKRMERLQANFLRHLKVFLHAKKQIYKIHHHDVEYAPEVCCYCKGFGNRKHEQCPACLGHRLVLVHQPASACLECKGTGESLDHQRCVICRGRGWQLISERVVT